MPELDAIDLAIHRTKVAVHRGLRWIEDRRDPISVARQSRLLVGLPQIVELRTELWNVALEPREWPLERGKVENLRVAARRFDGLEFEACQVFSFWAQLGPPIRARGFVEGRELREGCVMPGVGGGLCLLSNALYLAARRAGFEIVERHAHSRKPPGSQAALGEDATVAWNYVDLRFVAAQAWRLEVRLDARALVVGIRSERRRQRMSVLHERRQGVDAACTSTRLEGRWSGEAGPSCLSCDQPCDQAHSPPAPGKPATRRGRRSWLVDGAWPEFAALVGDEAEAGDRLFVPIDGQRLGQARYAWPRPAAVELRQFPLATVARSLRARTLASQGAARQRALLADDRRLAQAMAAALTPDDCELVVSQSLLPHLWRLGALGGRRVVVLMQRLPLFELQARLDEAHARWPHSPTLADFRADPLLVEAEAVALDDADTIVTPHTAIAACFPGKTRQLDWKLTRAEPRTAARSRRPGPLRLEFPASTVGRKGAWTLREALFGLARDGGEVELFIAGRELEGGNFWSQAPRGLTLHQGESRASAGPAAIDALVLPAWVEHEPRALLRALARGVPVLASPACGLGELPGLSSVTPGDVEALQAALRILVEPVAASARGA